jgi:hypothetical protein
VWAASKESPEANWISSTLREISDRMFPSAMRNALIGVRRVYLCPHRHLYQIPIHALFIDDTPLFQMKEVMYATKTTHIIDLLRRSPTADRRDVCWLVDKSPEFGPLRDIPMQFQSENRWGQTGLSIEDLLRMGAAAAQTVICCHGQMDEVRPGRARLQLWGGGRLLADDIHRAAIGAANLANGSGINYAGSEWLLAACESGRSRVTKMHTAPGLGLSFVSCGARRVTSSLYRVLPRTAGRFVRHYMKARRERRAAPYTDACRLLYSFGHRTRGAWAEAAAFVSFGLFGH